MSGPERVDFTPPPDLVEHIIEKHHLRDERGVVMCWNCRYRPAPVPRLWCDGCTANRKPYGSVSAR